MASNRSVLMLILALGLLACPVAAQTRMAAVQGTITDEQGGVLPGVTVTARHVQTNTTRMVTTSDLGRFVIPNLSPGGYELTAELQGFTTGKRTGIVLRVGQESTLDMSLGVGALEESVTVSGQAALVETQHTVGSHLNTGQIDALPTLTRDFADLAKLAPGVVTRGAAGSGFSAGGARQFQNNIIVDGSTNVMQFYGSQADLYPQDWIQEFNVITGGASAEFGQAIGGIVNVATRSGSNDFTGRVYGFFRDEAFDEAPFAGRFDAAGNPVFLDSPPDFDQQRVGVFFAGPLVKDKFFYFVGAESLEKDGTRILAISPYWRANGGPGSGGPAGVSNGPNGQGFDPIVPTKNINRAFLVKTDWNISDRHALTVRHNRTIKSDVNCTGQGGDGCGGGTTSVLEKSSKFEGPIWSVMGNLTNALSNNAFNEARVYFGVNKLYILGNWSGGLYGQRLVEANQDGRYSQSTYPGVAMGQTTTSGLEGETNLYLTENVVWVKGNHNMRFGGNVARVALSMDIDGSHKGRWSFPTDRVFNLNDPGSFPDSFSGAIGLGTWFEHAWNYNVFFQDSWRAHENLTLNLGLRYEIDNTIQIGNTLVDGYNNRVIARWGGGPVAQEIPKDLNNISPRVGLAWVPTASRRTVVRGSAGIFYDQNHFNYQDVYLNQTLVPDRRVDFNANSPTGNPFCTTGVVTPACRDEMRAYLAQSYPAFPSLTGPLQTEFFNGLSSDFRIPWTATFTGGLTQQVFNNLSVQADYTHSRGEDIILTRDLNIASIDADGRATRRDPRFTAINTQENLGFIRYHGLLTRIEWQGGGTRLGSSYTLSKCTTNSSATGVGGGAATNPLDLSIDDGTCAEDRRHNFVFDGSSMLPARFQVAAIYRYATGLPYSVTSRFVVFRRPEPRNSRHGDNEHNMDLRVSKEFSLGRGVRLSAFWEMFNALNTRNFINYAGSLESVNFGRPQSILPMRRQQLGIRVDF
ncbi:MAG: TonB-dependent receptor [Vicinamibacterales bacterium]